MPQRLTNWVSLLDAFFRDRRDRPFAWGSNDCVLFAADAIHAMTGVDVAADVRGKYSDADQAKQFLATIGADMADAVTKRLSSFGFADPCGPKFARRGDLALFNQEGRGETLGVISLDGLFVVGPGEKGLDRWPAKLSLRAWHI